MEFKRNIFSIFRDSFISSKQLAKWIDKGSQLFRLDSGDKSRKEFKAIEDLIGE